MRATPLLIAALTLLAGSELSAQSDWLRNCQREHRGNRDRERHCEEREQRIPARSTLTVDAGENGGVAVEGWDGRDIRVEARIQTWAETQAEADQIARLIRISTGETISAIGPSMRNRQGWSVSFRISVPHRTGLDLETRNGPISVEDVSGRISARALNGPLHLSGLSGDVRARTQNGPVHVTLDGTRWSGTGLDVETVNGPVHLRLPRNYSAELETGTVNGPVQFDLEQPIPVRGRLTRTIRSTLGSGGAPVRVITTNGPVTLRNS